MKNLIVQIYKNIRKTTIFFDKMCKKKHELLVFLFKQ